MDQLVANTINNKVEKENILGSDDEKENEGPETTHPRDMTIESDKGQEELLTLMSTMDEETKKR
jgi:hypothetical protein